MKTLMCWAFLLLVSDKCNYVGLLSGVRLWKSQGVSIGNDRGGMVRGVRSYHFGDRKSVV